MKAMFPMPDSRLSGQNGTMIFAGQFLARDQPARLAVVVLVDLELPRAVQREPICPVRIGARVFGARNLTA